MKNWHYDTKLTPDGPIKSRGYKHLMHKREAFLAYEIDLQIRLSNLKIKHQREVDDLDKKLAGVWIRIQDS